MQVGFSVSGSNNIIINNGFAFGDLSRFRRAAGHKDLLYIIETNVDFKEVIEAPLPMASLDTAVVSHWVQFQLLQKEFKIENLLLKEKEGDAKIAQGLEKAVYMHGADKKGHLVCCNVFRDFEDKDLYDNIFVQKFHDTKS